MSSYPELLEAVRVAASIREDAASAQSEADEGFREALERAREVHSWAELASAAGMSRSGVRRYFREERDR